MLKRNMSERELEVHDTVWLNQLALSHVVNCMTVAICLVADPRYWMPAPVVSMGDVVDVPRLIFSFAVAECVEFVHDGLFFIVTSKVAPTSAAPSLASARRMTAVRQCTLVSVLLGAVVFWHPRTSCLFCGARIPDSECFAE